jgi:uncharacterized integral membrane protein
MKNILKERNFELLIMGAVFLTLLILRATNVINCLWVWVFAPIWFPTLVLVFLAAITFILAGVFYILPRKGKPRE